MNKTDFLRKISSRKFQAAIVAVLIPLLTLMKVEEPTQTQIIAIITASLACLGYMFAEAHVDAAREKAPQFIEVLSNDNIDTETLENHGGGYSSIEIREGNNE